MSSNTKILRYDLAQEIQDTLDQLDEVKKAQLETNLFEILTNINTTMMADGEKNAILDLIVAEEKTEKTISTRVEALEKKKNSSVDSMIEGNFTEAFTYNSDGEIVKHVATGDTAFTTEYAYGPLVPKGSSTPVSGVTVLTGSTSKFVSSEGKSVVVAKTYSYDSNENIVGVETKTTIDNTAPSNATNIIASVNVSGDKTTARVQWTNPSDADFSHMNVYLREKVTGIVNKISSNITKGSTEFDVSLMPKNTEFEFVLKSVDKSKNEQETGVTTIFKTPTE